MAYRIDTADNVPVLPAPTAPGPNVDGFYTDGDPIGGDPGTVVTAEHINSLQEEICNVIEEAGLTLDKADNTQLSQAISILSDSHFAASTTGTNTYAASISAVDSYYAGLVVNVIFTIANTTASTININTLGAKSIITTNGSALSAGDLPAASIVQLLYTGTLFVLLNPALNDRGGVVASSFAVNGYIRFRNGMTLQWGSGFCPGPGGATLPFALAFSSACLGVVASPQGTAGTNTAETGSTSVASFNVYTGAAANITFWAFGV